MFTTIQNTLKYVVKWVQQQQDNAHILHIRKYVVHNVLLPFSLFTQQLLLQYNINTEFEDSFECL